MTYYLIALPTGKEIPQSIIEEFLDDILFNADRFSERFRQDTIIDSDEWEDEA